MQSNEKVGDELKCIRLTKKYDTGKYALDSLSFSIPAKGIFALIGRNGAGKTTLVRILATQLYQSSGTASICGMDTLKDEKALREQIACVPQEGRAISWLTARQMIVSYLMWRGYGRREANKAAEDSAKKLGISKFLDTQNRLLSGGTKRKVLVAMVMASEARIIFLDEPTTGLDPISRDELWSTLMELKKERFIFLTTHYLEEAEALADRIGILESGKLQALGTLDELRAKVKYPYSIKILSRGKAPKPREGNVVKGADGTIQITTTESEANRLSKELVDNGVRFSMNPLSLDDIFYFIVKKPIEEDYEQKEEWA
ncbi:MAG: ABC transporter ATP-binding protein [Candidatus Micrarchaeaceae archaeon]